MPNKTSKGEFAEFAKITKDRRLDLGLTQERVAEQVGVKPNYIGYLERGMRKPSDVICCRLADVLGLDRKELFFLANPFVREIIDPPEQPTESAWEAFTRDRALHRRRRITDEEMAVLEAISQLGDAQDPRDFLFVLGVIRLCFNRA